MNPSIHIVYPLVSIRRKGWDHRCAIHTNDSWISLGQRCCFRGRLSLARPECACPPSLSGYGCSGLIVPWTQRSSSHPSLSRPLWEVCFKEHGSCGRLNTSPVTGWSQSSSAAGSTQVFTSLQRSSYARYGNFLNCEENLGWFFFPQIGNTPKTITQKNPTYICACI